MRKLFVAAALLLCQIIYAQDLTPTTEAMPFMRYPRSVAQTSMAGAGSSAVSRSTAAFAAFSNPAVLAFVEDKVNAGANYCSWSPSASAQSFINGGAGVRLSDTFALTAAVAYQKEKDAIDGFNPTYILGAAGLAWKTSERFALGASVHYAIQNLLADVKFSSVALDAMAQWHFSHANVAAGVKNIGSPMRGKTRSYPLPASAKLAADFTMSLTFVDVMAAVDADYFFSGKYSVAGGVEMTLFKILALRGGYHYASPGAVLPSYASAGVGLNLGSIRLNAAYLLASEHIGGSFTGGVSVYF